MSARIMHVKETEERFRGSHAAVMTSTLTVGVVLIAIVIFGVICAGR